MKIEKENPLELRCVMRSEALGGLALKLIPITGRGFPDRTMLFRGVMPFFVEFKRRRLGRVAVQQKVWRDDLEALGFHYYVIDSDADFEIVLLKQGII